MKKKLLKLANNDEHRDFAEYLSATYKSPSLVELLSLIKATNRKLLDCEKQLVEFPGSADSNLGEKITLSVSGLDSKTEGAGAGAGAGTSASSSSSSLLDIDTDETCELSTTEIRKLETEIIDFVKDNNLEKMHQCYQEWIAERQALTKSITSMKLIELKADSLSELQLTMKTITKKITLLKIEITNREKLLINRQFYIKCIYALIEKFIIDKLRRELVEEFLFVEKKDAYPSMLDKINAARKQIKKLHAKEDISDKISEDLMTVLDGIDRKCKEYTEEEIISVRKIVLKDSMPQDDGSTLVHSARQIKAKVDKDKVCAIKIVGPFVLQYLNFWANKLDSREGKERYNVTKQGDLTGNLSTFNISYPASDGGILIHEGVELSLKTKHYPKVSRIEV